MALVYLGIGTNLGDRESNLNKAILYLRQEVGDIFNISAFYTSKPWGYVSENDFSNAALLVDTTLNPHELLETVHKIEKQMGRTVKTATKYEDRVIDIDILLYENRVINHPNLIIPHPRIAEREFVLAPLAEIAPELEHPVIGKTIKQLREELADSVQD